MEMNKIEKVVGILGGMGPDATVDLMQRIIRLTPAEDDIDHIRCIVDNNPKVPSRIKAIIEGTGVNPGPCMAEMGQRLQTWGADFLAIACNTAHAYYDYVQEAVDIPVIHLIDLVVDQVRQRFPDVRRIGFLASTAVQITGLYVKRFDQYGIDAVYPEPTHQDLLFKLIREIKAGNTGPDVIHRYGMVCENLLDQGAEAAIIACTELSVLHGDLPLVTIDSAEILAQEIVNIAKNGKNVAAGIG